MGLLTPEPGLIFWMIIIFGVVFFLLAKYGFPVIDHQDGRRPESIH